MVLLDLDYVGESMTSNLRLGHQGGSLVQGGFMQALTPQLFVGAQGVMNPGKGVIQQAFGGRYDTNDYGMWRSGAHFCCCVLTLGCVSSCERIAKWNSGKDCSDELLTMFFVFCLFAFGISTS